MEVLKKEISVKSKRTFCGNVLPRDELIKARTTISRCLKERQLSFNIVKRKRPGYSQATIIY